ncbi:unnamed protein product [Owenia fusiformis]|uniref:Uncharacterized protein n=1 Tax=Owenia fusiformis TaxID=6347 RepID=A0A8J1TWG4_OWEFU|nr:unnamed protein product [Owenia fusiformis]
MKKAVVKPPDAKPELDKIKRVYRAAVDTIKRLDDITKQKKSYKEIFSADAIGLRGKLRDYCERLMFYDPVEYGRKAEELLWRKVFYDIIQLMKQNKKHMRPGNSMQTAFRTHLAAAEGFYHHLIFKLQKEYHVDVCGLVDCHLLPEPRSHKKHHPQKRSDIDPAVHEWAMRACHRCLVYLGDLARYAQDIEGLKSVILSERCYYQAIALYPTYGMPHNQLGTLVGTKHYNCEAAYHYMRCLLCTNIFEGASGNLQRLFEKNRKRYEELSKVSPRDLPPELQRKHLSI